MTSKHLNVVCKPGRGEETCSYLGLDGNRFLCLKNTGLRTTIEARRKAGAIRAMGDNCEGDMDILEFPSFADIQPDPKNSRL